MENLMAFLSSLASYGLVYFVFIAAIVTAVAIGITARKIVDKNKMKKINKTSED